MKRKLKLEALEVKSFSTNLNKNTFETVKGGDTPMETWETSPCPDEQKKPTVSPFLPFPNPLAEVIYLMDRQRDPDALDNRPVNGLYLLFC